MLDEAPPALFDTSAAARARDVQGETLLHHAARAGHERVMRAVLRAGTDAGAADDFGQTPLHAAAGAGHAGAVALLLEAGASAAARDQDGRTPLRMADGAGVVHALLPRSPPDDVAALEPSETVRAWLRGEHPAQRLRAEAERAALAASHEMPPDVAAVVGDYLCSPPCRFT